MMRRLAVAAAATLLLGLGAAQAQDYTLPPLAGQAKLNDGFSPDPRTVDITVGGGTIDGTTVGGACNGFITDAPTYRVFYTAGVNPLTFTVEAEDDTTLIISDPEGNWVCNDDDPVNLESLNPVITFDAPLSGQYDIWVGTYAQIAEGAPATLVITAQALSPVGGTLDYTLPAVHGDIELAAGFTPDPQTFEVTAGGPADAARVDDSCWGYVTEAPTLRLQYTAGTFPLYISAVSADGTDLVLVISDPEGNWICDDDGLGDLQPLVTFDPPLPGQYDIWVGTYGTGPGVPATLSISEVEPASGGGALNWELPPLYGEQDVATGFTPDPITVDVTAGGPIEAALVEESCRGFVTEASTYRIYYTAGDLPLIFSVTSDADTTLVIADPNGEWFCDDDSAGDLNPQITFDLPANGVYDIWVGTYDGGEAPATLTITEIAGDGPMPVEPSGSIGAGTLDYTLTPAFGEVALNAGFSPDPHEVTVTGGGQIQVSTALQNDCRGYADAAPTYRLNYTPGSFPLAIYVRSDRDTTLIISGPDGEWICDDDSGEGLNPAVYLEAPTGGQYDIWVGTYSAGATAEATLFISETVNPIEVVEPLPSPGPPPSPVPAPTGTLDPTLAPNFGEATLTAGFSPDPHAVEITTGGEIAATQAVPQIEGQDLSCRGYVTEAPDYLVEYTAGAWPLIISVLSEADTTLVIHGPDGAWRCDDDGGDGLNPLVEFPTPMSGRYAIWVGTYGQGQQATAATLRISEIGGGGP